ncbi:hypothetical protein L0128_16365, partial [candidate division KSB1 bacterium]|nr:hypothetical protein [candidate division KSB1 bacterium]
MEKIIELLLNALPEAIGALLATGIIALLSFLFVKRFRKTPSPPPLELPTPPPAPEIYANLPSRTEFIGRKNELRRVLDALNSRWPLVCIDGIGGIGKTCLALEVTHECLRLSKIEITEKRSTNPENVPIFEGFIWTSAKDRELRLNDILDA